MTLTFAASSSRLKDKVRFNWLNETLRHCWFLCLIYTNEIIKCAKRRKKNDAGKEEEEEEEEDDDDEEQEQEQEVEKEEQEE